MDAHEQAHMKPRWWNYVVQSLLAAGAVFAPLLIMSLEQMVIVASIGSTAFIVFAMPNSYTARTRSVIGGHLVGLASGSLLGLAAAHAGMPLAPLFYALAVGLSVLLMAVTDTEHPPASGTALGVAAMGPSREAVIAVVVGAVLLSLAHRVLRPCLRDLV